MSAESERWDLELSERGSPAPLLQTWAWGEVQSRAGWSVERVRLLGSSMASVLLRKVGPAREAYVARGPVPATPDAIGALVDWARRERIARLVIEPDAPEDFGRAFADRGFVATAPIQPQHTRILPLKQPEEMLKTFRHGRRYNIRAGIKRGVAVEEGRDAAELGRQSGAVERREAINLPDSSYYGLLLDLLPWCRTYTARAPDDGEPLAAVLVARHDGRAYSLFAGRSGRRSELMGNDLAWWTAISAAAMARCRDFDLWGVPPPGADPRHPWTGIGVFKSEFGGDEVAYCGAWELGLSASGMAVINAERKVRASIRGLKRNIP